MNLQTKVLDILTKEQKTTAELANLTGSSESYIGQLLTNLIYDKSVFRVRKGRTFIYTAKKAGIKPNWADKTGPNVVKIAGDLSSTDTSIVKKVMIIRNGMVPVNVDRYSALLDTYTQTGTRRSYFGIGSSIVSMFITSASLDEIKQNLETTFPNISYAMSESIEGTVQAVVDYMQDIVTSKVKEQVTRYFAKFEEKPLTIQDVLKKIENSGAELTQEEWNLLRETTGIKS